MASGKKGWWRTQLGRIRDSWNREMGIETGGGFTWRDAGNLAQSLLTGGMTGVSGRIYDFNTQRPMQGFNPFERLGGGGQRFPPGGPPGPGIATGQPGRPAPRPIPFPQFTDWNAGQQGPPADPNYDQIHQGPPEALAGGGPNRGSMNPSDAQRRMNDIALSNIRDQQNAMLSEEERNFSILHELAQGASRQR